jgi:hypothetical protein
MNIAVSFPGLLFLVFLVLKLQDTISWSWWWVTAPLWGPSVLVIIALIFVAMCTTILGTTGRSRH